MLNLFLTFIISLHNTSNVIHLNAVDFRDNVIKRDGSSIWAILFIGNVKDVHNACKKALNEFSKASETKHNITNFCIVNLTEEPFLQRYLGISAIPMIRIYFSGGSEDYRQKISAKKIQEFIIDKIPNHVRLFSKSWIKETVPSVVLFTEQTKIPSLWSFLSLDYEGKDIRFGICNQFHIHRQLSITMLPTVIFYNQSKEIHYHGTMNKEELTKAINSFLDGTLTSDDEFDDEGFYNMVDFKEQCNDREFCVLYTGNNLSKEYKKIRLINKKQGIKFFYGKENYPFSQMKDNNYYIWNPRRKGFIVVSNIEELDSSIDRVINGAARWVKPNEL